jgi:hypothetical protein
MSRTAFEDAVKRAVTPGLDRLFAGVALAAAARGKGTLPISLSYIYIIHHGSLNLQPQDEC